MINFELMPTKENIYTTFDKNALNRNQDIYDFLSLILNLESNWSIALDGAWGSGKTFFIKQLQMIFEAFNDAQESEFSEWFNEIKGNIQEKDLKETLTQNAIFPIYYDSWKNDNDQDPILSILYCALSQLGIEDVSSEISPYAEAIFHDIIKYFTKIDTSKLFLKKDILKEIKSQKNIEQKVFELLKILLPPDNKKVVFFIDELDRCRPDFAIKLLERIKHYLTADNIIFVFSVNLVELQHTVNKLYGSNFSSAKYLDRFFNLKISLPKVKICDIYALNEVSNKSMWLDKLCLHIINKLNLEIRDISKFLMFININRECLESTNHAQIMQFITNIMVPFGYALKISDYQAFNSYSNGSNKEILIDLLDYEDIREEILSYLIIDMSKETFDNNDTKRTIIDWKQRVSEIYTLITHNTENHIYINNNSNLHVNSLSGKRFKELLNKT